MEITIFKSTSIINTSWDNLTPEWLCESKSWLPRQIECYHIQSNFLVKQRALGDDVAMAENILETRSLSFISVMQPRVVGRERYY